MVPSPLPLTQRKSNPWLFSAAPRSERYPDSHLHLHLGFQPRHPQEGRLCHFLLRSQLPARHGRSRETSPRGILPREGRRRRYGGCRCGYGQTASPPSPDVSLIIIVDLLSFDASMW